jgi:hypothetical protein
MSNKIIEALEKVAQELPEVENVITGKDVLIKIAAAKKAMDLVQDVKTETGSLTKEAARGGGKVVNNSLRRIGLPLAQALTAGIGLGLAGATVNYTHDKIKELSYKKNLHQLIKEIKKKNPELANASDKEIEELLLAGHTIAPNLMENPTIAASFANIGHSLGGKIDPNTIKLFADAGNKANYKRIGDNIYTGTSLVSGV